MSKIRMCITALLVLGIMTVVVGLILSPENGPMLYLTTWSVAIACFCLLIILCVVDIIYVYWHIKWEFETKQLNEKEILTDQQYSDSNSDHQ